MGKHAPQASQIMISSSRTMRRTCSGVPEIFPILVHQGSCPFRLWLWTSPPTCSPSTWGLWITTRTHAQSTRPPRTPSRASRQTSPPRPPPSSATKGYPRQLPTRQHEPKSEASRYHDALVSPRRPDGSRNVGERSSAPRPYATKKRTVTLHITQRTPAGREAEVITTTSTLADQPQRMDGHVDSLAKKFTSRTRAMVPLDHIDEIHLLDGHVDSRAKRVTSQTIRALVHLCDALSADSNTPDSRSSKACKNG